MKFVQASDIGRGLGPRGEEGRLVGGGRRSRQSCRRVEFERTHLFGMVILAPGAGCFTSAGRTLFSPLLSCGI